MSNTIRKLAGQTAIYGLSSIVGRLLNYLLVPLYTYKFTNAADYGVVSELYAWVAFLVVLLTFGMETAYFRFRKENENEKEVFASGFFILGAVNLFFLLCIFLFNQSISEAMLYGNHPEYIVLLAGIVFLDGITALPLARLRAEEKALKFAGVNFASILTNIVLNLCFMLILFDPQKPEQGVFYILLANLISSALKPVLLYKAFLNFSIKPNWHLVRGMLFYSAPLVVAGFAGIINETLDRILLKHLLYDSSDPASLIRAEAQVGIYSACYKLAMLVTIIIQAFRYAAEPFFFAQHKNENKNKIYVKVMNYFIAFLCLVFLGVSLNIDILKYFIQNESYWVGLGVVPILLLANVFLGIYYNQSIWYKLSNKTKFGAYISICGALLTIGINFVFIPIYGFWASAWATFIVYGFQMVVSYFLGQKHYPIPYNLRKFAAYLSSSLIIFYLFSKLQFDSTILNFLIKNIGVFLFVLIFLFVERPLNNKLKLSD
jgi:O-antigen/teichoic acid export membrane protein